ncbi:50S ribosomal protein L18 [Pseudobacteriovorax antillogorgiicola]|uniref:Large ribosomal subunit protein uL18 n=1 Tax=Pseudobacteriovorax antillogorgiicola TaxID=1513793 RepID=A0A1Y6B2Y4_9BACT|nr:50S ribosomal protein L18 [Pseudobacteriovorax antillogorgiicola]TCS59377.1 LSU ribosomal protein L18P [Pseudobacteriovorax antillogorgiicola]SME88806.1 LSU ribosomal protein L18P [Pseudobacteriovorax antillogorgiicola]
MSNTNKKNLLRLKRKKRIRKKLSGTGERPRLSLFRSARHIYAQVINDETGVTLASVNSYKKGSNARANKDLCTELGKQLAEACKSKNIEKVVFDKNGYAFHGRVEAFASGAREGGLQF